MLLIFGVPGGALGRYIHLYDACVTPKRHITFFLNTPTVHYGLGCYRSKQGLLLVYNEYVSSYSTGLGVLQCPPPANKVQIFMMLTVESIQIWFSNTPTHIGRLGCLKKGMLCAVSVLHMPHRVSACSHLTSLDRPIPP